MTRRSAIGTAALAALTGSLPLQAHHSASMFDPGAIWVRGTVVHYEAVNPHTTLVLEAATADGQVQRWTVEGPRLGRITAMGTQPAIGDTLEVCGFPLKDSVTLRRSSPDPYGMSERFVHGHALVMPDGHMELFGAYGKLDHCVRTDDDVHVWSEFLNSYRHARAAWCSGLNFNIESTAPQAVVEEINALMSDSCGAR